MGLYTTNPTQRTVNGIDVGSSERDLKRLIPGIKCSHTTGRRLLTIDLTVRNLVEAIASPGQRYGTD